jgi:tetraacyldisaccharide-1-P 4'-kinase
VLVAKLLADDPGGVVDSVTATAAEQGARGPVLAARLCITRVRDGRDWRDADSLRNRRVLAFAGLGRPQGFADLLADAGAEVVATRWFPDHHPYSEAEVRSLVAEAQSLNAWAVTTGKDAVKLAPAAPVREVEVELEPVDGSWDRLWSLLPGGAP